MKPLSAADEADFDVLIGPANWALFKREPERYLALVESRIAGNPDNPHNYFAKQDTLHWLGRYAEALEALDRGIAMDDEPSRSWFQARGELLMKLGRFEEALADLDKAHDLDEVGWTETFAPLVRATCHAQLGHLDAALADCATLPDDHWTPGLGRGLLPKGNKAEVVAALTALAIEARGTPPTS